MHGTIIQIAGIPVVMLNMDKGQLDLLPFSDKQAILLNEIQVRTIRKHEDYNFIQTGGVYETEI